MKEKKKKRTIKGLCVGCVIFYHHHHEAEGDQKKMKTMETIPVKERDLRKGKPRAVGGYQDDMQKYTKKNIKQPPKNGAGHIEQDNPYMKRVNLIFVQ